MGEEPVADRKVYRFALIGDPVEHSRSPRIHAEALRLSGLEGSYLAMTTGTDALDAILGQLRTAELSGLNVTMPLKIEALRRSDRSTPEAAESGSANTLRAVDGQVEAHSTDVVAFRELFDAMGHPGPMMILGAGGSARAALAAWERGSVLVSPRQRARARGLAGVEVVPWGTVVEGALLVNATPLGMQGEPLPAGVVEAATALIDLPYGRDPSPAVVSALEAGLPVVDGVEFLVRQAAHSFEWWTSKAIDWEALLATARNA
jgi:shikimate dehydrogenase